jgi:hypothetical protein
MIRPFFWCALSLFLTMSAPGTAWAASLKCGTALISDGDTKSQVSAKCGEPADKQTRKVLIRQRVARGLEVYVEKEIEEWTYRFGPHRFDQHVVFEDGHLVDVRSGDYGR